MFFKVHDPVVLHTDSFAFQQLLHQSGSPEMMFAGQDAGPVDHPVCRNLLRIGMGCIHGPTNHPGRAPGTQKLGNRPVGRHPAVGYLCGNLPDFPEERVFRIRFTFPGHSSFLSSSRKLRIR